MRHGFCKSCGDPIDADEYSEARENGPLPRDTGEYDSSEYCCSCFCELATGRIPLVTDSSLPAPNTGLTPRQRYALGKTDGG